jgi:hypothetical protein
MDDDWLHCTTSMFGVFLSVITVGTSGYLFHFSVGASLVVLVWLDICHKTLHREHGREIICI